MTLLQLQQRQLTRRGTPARDGPSGDTIEVNAFRRGFRLRAASSARASSCGKLLSSRAARLDSGRRLMLTSGPEVALRSDQFEMAKRKAPAAAAVPKQPAPAPAASSSAAKKGFKNKRARFEGPAEPVKLIKKTPKAVKKVLKSVPTPPAPSTFIVSVGSYERLLYGLSCEFVPKAVGSTSALPYDLAVTPVFSFPAHLSSLRSVSASILPSPGTGSERKVGGKYLVSGGTDEIIKVWDLRRKKEVGTLEGEANGSSVV